MTEPGLYWARYGKPEASSLDELVKVGSDGNVEVLFPYNYKALLENWTLGPRIPSAEELEEMGTWTSKPKCPQCQKELLMFCGWEQDGSPITSWACEDHGHFDVETRYRVTT